MKMSQRPEYVALTKPNQYTYLKDPADISDLYVDKEKDTYQYKGEEHGINQERKINGDPNDILLGVYRFDLPGIQKLKIDSEKISMAGSGISNFKLHVHEDKK